MTVERETKLQAPPAFRLPELAGDGLVATPFDAQRLVTVYVDTPDLRISRWGGSLRHRRRNGRGGRDAEAGGSGWTVKLPHGQEGSLLVRTEHHFEGDDPRKLPVAAADLLRAYVRGAELAPVARLQTQRRGVELRDELGRAVASVTDDEVSVMQGRRVASRFRELEVELDPAAPAEIADAVVSRLRDAGAGDVENVPKLVRALGPRAAEPPEVVEDEIDESSTVAEVVRTTLASSVRRLLTHDAGVRLGEDPEDVHQARVATRRIRSDLRALRDVVEPSWSAHLRDELRGLGHELGAVRDAEVLRDRLRGRASMLAATDRDAADGLLAGLDRSRAEARDRLLEAIREPRYVQLLDVLVEAARTPEIREEIADAPAARALRPVLEAPWKHLKAAVDHARGEETDGALHQARIRAKRVRYAAEALAPVFGKRAAAFARAAEGLQDVLGEHQDAVVAGAWLRDAASSSPSSAFVAGELAAIEADAARAARASWPNAWKALSRKKLRFWA